MIDRARICVTASVETALKKLNKASIAAYAVKKQGAEVSFSVEEEYVQKVFAIFSHPCYNISIRRKSLKSRLKNLLLRRLGLPIGAILFTAACVISNSLVLKIKVVGNADFMERSILEVAGQCGAKRWAVCSALDKPLITSRILAMDGVSFCSVHTDGGILVIEVRTGGGESAKPRSGDLKSDCEGEIIKIVAISGTAQKTAGDFVAAGDVLIGAYGLTESGVQYSVPAVGWAEIKRRAHITLFYPQESESNTADALAAPSLYAENVVEKSYRISPCEGGVTYEVTFDYTVILSLNME